MGRIALGRWLSRFARSRAGSIAPAFAVIATFALAPTVAVGVDVARGMSGRNNLQDALDAAALAVAHLPAGSNQATVTATAQSWLNANLHDSALGPVTLNVSMATQQVNLSATSTVTTTLGALGSFSGMGTLPIKANSVVKWGLNHIELALVLDNTGSMSQDSKLSNLQSAASSLVDTLSQSASQSGDPNALKVGVVPFSMTVNIGSTYQSASWMSGAMPTAYGTDLFNGTTGLDRFALLKTMNTAWGGCVESRPMPYDVQDTPPTSSNPATLFVPFFAPDEPDANTIQYSTYSGNYTYNNGKYYYAFYNNYLSDGTSSTNFNTRQGGSTKYKSKPANGTNPYWGDKIGPNSGCQTAALQRLTTNMSTVKSELNAMIAAGDTEIPLGLMWGWHVLSPNAPFADGAAYGTPNTLKIVVLVTDGQNTYGTGMNGNDNSAYTAMGYGWQNRWTSVANPYSDPVTYLNSRLTQVCNNMKAQGVIVYTLPLEVTDPSIKSLLQNCASQASYYIDVTSSSQLQAAFSNVAGSISALRIAS